MQRNWTTCLSSSSNWIEQACLCGGRKIPHAASGKVQMCKPFSYLFLNHICYHPPTGQSKVHDQFQHQYDGYLRVWRLGGRGICGCFCNPTIQFKLAFKAFSRKAYQACFFLYVIALSFPFSWSTLSVFGQSLNPLSNATSHLSMMSTLNGGLQPYSTLHSDYCSYLYTDGILPY